MSTINVNAIDKESGSTLTLGTSGTTVDIPSGATLDVTGATVSGLSAGKVLQVVQDTKTDAFTTTSTSFTDLSGLSLSITPSATSSKILIIMSIGTMNVAPIAFPSFKIVRGSTDVLVGSSGGQATAYGVRDGSTGIGASPISATVLDSPSSTSALTYKVQCKTSAQTLYVNRWDGSASTFASTLIAMEIGA